MLTLFQPEGADYAHPITASTPGFQNLKTALLFDDSILVAGYSLHMDAFSLDVVHVP